MCSRGTPFVEKFRPTHIDNIVLDPLNRQIMQNIIASNHFPNLLFFGPPGTGKTTTIINLINLYQEKNNAKNKDLIIHLNASDERGIDIIRNQINSFVNSKPLFNNGMKFVILDEVDYMTKSAQQALRYLLQNYSSTVRFCLICNYISRIDEGLQNEFIRLRFNQLPKVEIIRFLRHICDAEHLEFQEKDLEIITKLYRSDIRSMVNFLQSNQNQKLLSPLSIIENHVWEDLLSCIQKKKTMEEPIKLIHDTSVKYNIDKKNLIKDWINYVIRNRPDILSKHSDFLNFAENVLHSMDCSSHIYVQYVVVKFKKILS
jgi:replication factor C subunit 3/5